MGLRNLIVLRVVTPNNCPDCELEQYYLSFYRAAALLNIKQHTF